MRGFISLLSIRLQRLVLRHTGEFIQWPVDTEENHEIFK